MLPTNSAALDAPKSGVLSGAQPANRACLEERPRISRVCCRAMKTAALPLRISLPLDQVDTTVTATVLSSVHGNTMSFNDPT